MPNATPIDHTKWVLYTWPDATFSAIKVPEQWRYTQPVPASALGAARFQNSYDALDLLLRARRGTATGEAKSHHRG
jgi:hypothetical protein